VRPAESQQAKIQNIAQDRSQDFEALYPAPQRSLVRSILGSSRKSARSTASPLSDLLRCIANAFEQVGATWFVFGAQAKLEK
jgi:hypothetical protein